MQEETNYEEYLSQKPYETKQMNLERRRIFFKVLQASRDQAEAVKYSNLGVNIKYMKCSYPDEVMKTYQKYLSH